MSEVRLYPSAIGPIRLTECDTLLIWSPVEVLRGEHANVIEVEWLWRWRRPYTARSGLVRFAQFGPLDFRRRLSTSAQR
jgi:hypothetical protein